MPRLLIDITRLLDRLGQGRLPTGIDRVCQAWVAHFGVARGDDAARAVLQWRGHCRVLSRTASRRLFHLVSAPPPDLARRVRAIVLADAVAGPPWRAVWGEPLAPGAFYLNVGHTGLHRPTLACWLEGLDARPVFMVHDLIPIAHAEYCRVGESLLHAQRMTTVLRHAAGVVANSRDTLDALDRFAQGAGLSMPPAQVAHLAPAALPVPSLQRPLEAPYFVVLGTLEGRKNHLTLLQAWQGLVQALGDSAPELVIIGQRGWQCEAVFELLDHSESLRGVVHELPECSDAELSTWLGHAQALLFPSFAEGFGMPLVEALGVGTPVIASELAVFREIAGDVPDYLDPLDGPGWSRAVLDYADPDNARRQAQIARIPGFSAPTWAQHFGQVERLFSAIQKSRGQPDLVA